MCHIVNFEFTAIRYLQNMHWLYASMLQHLELWDLANEMIFESRSISFTKNIHLKCNLKATEFSNLITQLCIRQLFSDLHSSFFSQELSEWIPLGVKGQIRNLFRDFFFFWWCNFRNHRVWSRITSSKDLFPQNHFRL